jgi:hypothetical protein
MGREFCVPLERRSTDEGPLAVVGCENARGDIAHRSFKRRFSRRGRGYCEPGTDDEGPAHDHEAIITA